MIKRFLKIVLFAMMCAVVGVFIVYMIGTSSDKSMRVECYQYQSYAKEFTGFWITAQDKVTCDRFGIEIDARVK